MIDEKILVLKLVTGEEVIGKITTTDYATTYAKVPNDGVGNNIEYIEDPYLILLQNLGDRIGMTIMPYIMYKEGNVIAIPSDRIIFSVRPTKKLVSDYNARISKIALPQTSIIA